MSRPAYWELRLPGRAQCRRDEQTGRLLPRDDAIVLGRKHCAGCGHWRHVCDFGYIRNRGLRARCRACWNVESSRRYYEQTPEQMERLREYWRIWQEGHRRERGIPRREYHNHTTVIDRVERIFLPVAPLLPLIEQATDGYTMIAPLSQRAGVSERAIYRWRYGESARVRIDVGDRIAVALGLHSSLIWRDEW